MQRAAQILKFNVAVLIYLSGVLNVQVPWHTRGL